MIVLQVELVGFQMNKLSLFVPSYVKDYTLILNSEFMHLSFSANIWKNLRCFFKKNKSLIYA